MIILRTALATAAAMSAGVTSAGVDMNQINAGAVQAIFTGAPVGTIKLQISCDPVTLVTSVTNWADYSGSSQSVSGAGTFIWNFFNAGYQWLQLVYTPASGSGSLTVNFTGKRIAV